MMLRLRRSYLLPLGAAALLWPEPAQAANLTVDIAPAVSNATADKLSPHLRAAIDGNASFVGHTRRKPVLATPASVSVDDTRAAVLKGVRAVAVEPVEPQTTIVRTDQLILRFTDNPPV
ncbi:MAG: hypothetical protein JWM57_790, partial [Phycisphaerales bacterium]|nr:hypothetical protein [Phycisphaerales bacterium]